MHVRQPVRSRVVDQGCVTASHDSPARAFLLSQCDITQIDVPMNAAAYRC